MQNSNNSSKSLAPVDYLYEDDHIIVINKGIGWIVHKADSHQGITLCDQLIMDGVSLCGGDNNDRVGVIHRLDKMTEGVMMLTKSEAAYQGLAKQFKERTIQKEYIAMVHGDISDDYLKIDQPIRRHPKKRHLFQTHPAGKESLTEVYVVKRYNTKTLCKLYPKTGRTHQLRVHLSARGYPIVQDPYYGKKKHGEGQYLQATRLSFTHPIDQKRYSFEVPMSKRVNS